MSMGMTTRMSTTKGIMTMAMSSHEREHS